MLGLFVSEDTVSGYPELRDVALERESAINLVDTSEIKESPSYIFVKRFIDIVAALLLIILFLPIIPVVGILIKLDSQGPVLFKQK